MSSSFVPEPSPTQGHRGRAQPLTPLELEMMSALIAAKMAMWIDARHQWTMADFKNWAVIQQIDAALDKARAA